MAEISTPVIIILVVLILGMFFSFVRKLIKTAILIAVLVILVLVISRLLPGLDINF